MTCVMSSMSRPRAATSVATSVSTRPAPKRAERLLALRLGLVAVHRQRLEVMRPEPLDQAVGTALSADEHERQAPLLVAQLPDQRVQLRLGLTRTKRCCTSPRRSAGWTCSRLRASACRRSRPAHLAVERGREEQRLALARQLGERCGRRAGGSPCRASGPPRRGSAPAPAERDHRAPVEEVLEAARGGDQHVGAAAGLIWGSMPAPP